jgi:polar amino acid transport system substrate-binding protein
VALWRYREVKKVNTIILEKNEALNKISKEYAILAITDRLTNLYNRYKLDEILNSNKNLADRYESSFGVIMVDIDHFKNINDTFGHQVGDEVLKTFASILLNSSRKSDIAGRWGGEEFLIIAPNATKESITTFAENLRAEIEKFQFEKIGQLSISLGASIYQENESIEELIKRADKALYTSKKRGRNRTSFL